LAIPLIIAAGILCRETTRRSSNPVLNLLVVALIIGAVIAALLILLLSTESVVMIFDWEAIAFMLGISMLWMQLTRPHLQKPAARHVFVCIVASLFIAFSGWWLLGDFILPRHYAVGTIEKRLTPTTKHNGSFYINQHAYSITNDIFNSVAVGDYVRIEYGMGSNGVFKVEKLPAGAGKS
jgi:hypothetical protein